MGDEPRSYHRTWLWRRLAWAVQAKEYGGLSAQAQARLAELLPHAEVWMPLGKRGFARNETTSPLARDRLSPGTVIARPYLGRVLQLLVREGGRFELDGVIYPSLTAAAKGATGSAWNGPLFWFGREREKTA